MIPHYKIYYITILFACQTIIASFDKIFSQAFLKTFKMSIFLSKNPYIISNNGNRANFMMFKKWFTLLLCVAIICGFSWLGYGCSKKSYGVGRYEITAEYFPENLSLRGTEKVTFENHLDSEVEVLKFQIYPNAYRRNATVSPLSEEYKATGYYAGESYGEIIISSVHGAKDWEITGVDKNILSVFLERSLYPGDKVVLDIAFTVKLAKVNHRLGVTEKTVNLGNFYPILCGVKNGGFAETVYHSKGDPFYFDVADYTLTVTTPKDYFVASSGELIKEQMLESKIKRVYTGMQTRDFALVLSKAYARSTAQAGNTQIHYYHYADEKPQNALSCIVNAVTCFKNLFGDYPYFVFTVAQTGYCKGVADYTGLLFLSDSLSAEETTRAIVYGVAKSWWKAVVGSDTLENSWQSDGLSAYSTLVFFEKHGEYGVDKERSVAEYLKEYRAYYDIYGSVLGRTDTRMIRTLDEYENEHEYNCIAKYKTVIMLDTLRKSVGDKKFFSALKRYYEDNAFTTASVGEFISAFEKSGVAVAGFFDGFLSGKGIL